MSAKTKEIIDQRAPQIEYKGIKSLRSLAMKNYLVTGGLLSLVESYNNAMYAIIFHDDTVSIVDTAKYVKLLMIIFDLLATE